MKSFAILFSGCFIFSCAAIIAEYYGNRPAMLGCLIIATIFAVVGIRAELKEGE